MKQIVIVKNSNSKIKIESTYIEITNIYENRVIGLRNISELYLNQQISVIPAKLIKLLGNIEIFFIDHHGHILGKLKRENR